MYVLQVSEGQTSASELLHMIETRWAIRRMIDEVDFEDRELLRMYAYALYEIHCIYLGGGGYSEIVKLFNSKCAHRIIGF